MSGNILCTIDIDCFGAGHMALKLKLVIILNFVSLKKIAS